MADRNLLARATEQSSSPTPGYLYNDIAKQSASSPSIAAEILSYLVRRLDKNNAHVKYKTLKTIAMVCQNPNSRGVFKRAVVQDTLAVSGIKSCLQYRGRPDAVHGDELYDRVRVQAKETLDAVYSDDPSSSSMGGGGGGMSSMGGGGYSQPSSGGYGGYGGGGGGGMSHSAPSQGGPRKMEGIGNPMFKDPRLEQSSQKGIGDMTIGDVAAAAVEGFKGIVKDPLARKIPGAGGVGGQSSHRPGGYGGGGYGGPSGGWSSAPPGQSQLASSTNGQWTMASNRGPNAISSETYKSGGNNVSSGIGGSWGGASSASRAPSVAAQSRAASGMPNPHHNPVVNISGHPGAANTSGTFEKNLIMELCPPGGMKPEPPADKLLNFCQSLSDLNSDLICPALLDMLEDGQPWIIRAKVLCVMEKCVSVGNEIAQTTGGNNVYADFFHMCHEEITPLASHSRAAVREPAKRVCAALGLNVPAFAASAPKRSVAAPVAQPQAEAPNLLDFDDAPAAPPAVAPPPVPTEEPPMPPPAVAPPAPSGDMFGGMNIKSNAPAAPAATPPVPPPVASPVPAPVVNAEADFLGAPVVESIPAVEATSSSSALFGDMTVKPTSNVGTGKENIENSVEAPAPSSGFSFMNSGGSEPNKPEPPSKASFDPLLSLGAPNSAVPSQSQIQQPMAMNPQMAMVMQQQQQQILMMQAQMQQMQMGGGAGVPQQQQQRFMMMQQQQRQGSTGSMGGNRSNVMGAMGGHGVATSFAFMDDPNKVKQDASNKKFDFVQDAMKGAK